MKKIFLLLAFVSSFAFGQNYPSPTYNNVTINGTATIPHAAITGGTITGLSAPIPISAGGAGAATATGATSQLQYLQGATGSVARTLTSKFQDGVSVLDFSGCDTSGATDSSACIQNATNATSSASKTLYFPAGTSKLLSYVTWPAGTKWVCEPGAVISLDPSITLGATIGGTARAMYTTGTGSLALDGCTFQSVKTGLTK